MRTPSAFHLSPVAAALALILVPAAALAASPYVVTTNADTLGGPSLSLRDAITQANANCGAEPSPVIQFNLPAPFTISPSTPLPSFICNIAPVSYTPTIDGYTQPGASANTSSTGFNANIPVVLNGASQTSGFCGLEWDPYLSYGGNLTIKGLKVENFSYAGLDAAICGLVNLYGNVFNGNDTGVDPDYGSVIGSSATSDRNVFVRNAEGVHDSRGGTQIINNFFGTLTGTTASANDVGIYVGGGSTVSGNVVSGNTTVGIHVFGDYGGTVVSGNTVGLDASGTSRIANGIGILVDQSGFPGTSVDNNLVAGNGNAGIKIDHSDYVSVLSNTIGLNYGGTPVPNMSGIDAFCSGYLSINSNTVSGNSVEGVIVAGRQFSTVDFNTITRNGTTGLRFDLSSCAGGFNAAYGNTITGNRGDGILVTGGSVGNNLSENSSFGNSRKNINLNNSATPLPNDGGDTDGGSNDQQNWPVLTSVVQTTSNQTDIDFTLDSNDGTYTVEFYSNSAAGGPAGENFLGSTSVTLYGGPFSGVFTAYGLYDHISALAVNLSYGPLNQFGGDTSEYSPQKAAVTAPAVSFTPSSFIFPNQVVLTESAPRTAIVRSLGDQPYIISGFCSSAPDAKTGMPAISAVASLCSTSAFTCETTCEIGHPYAKGESCRVTTTFIPSGTGTFFDDFGLCDNTASGFNELLLRGNGIPPPPITVTPSSFDFGGVPVGNQSDAMHFTVRNISYGTIFFSTVSTSGDFQLVDTTCGTSLGPIATCDAAVAFVPTQSGDALGSLDVVYPDPRFGDAKPATIITPMLVASSSLTGNGLQGGELVLPDAIELGAAPVGGNPVTRTIELKNIGTQPVNFASVTVTAPFTVVNNCTAPLAPNATCTLVVGYQATEAGSRSGTLTVVTDASGGSGDIPVHATGQTSAAALLAVQPSFIGFGSRTIGSQTVPHTVTIRNIGGAPASLSLATTSVDFLLAGGSCGASLAPSASCTADVAFRPLLGFGTRTGALVINSNATNSPQNVNLGGTSCRPFIGFGNRAGDGGNCSP